MKRFSFTLLMLVPLLVSAQSFILRGGKSVYRYDKTQKEWSSNPLPLGTLIKKSDFIKSQTIFTLEVVPDEWYKRINPLFTNCCYTYIAYPKGVRMDSKLKEFDNSAKLIPGGYVSQGDETGFIDHLSWVYNNNYSDSISSVDIIIETKTSGLCIDNISTSDSLRITLINKEDVNMYVYLLWKDNDWVLWDWNLKNCVGICVSPFCCYSRTTGFDKFIGEQDLFFICSLQQLDDKILKSFKHTIPHYNENYNQSKGYSYAVKRIITTH